MDTPQRPNQPDADDPLIPQLSAEGRQTVATVRKALEEALLQLQSQEQAEAIVEHLLAAIQAMNIPSAAALRDAEGLTSTPEARTAITQAARPGAEQRLEQTLLEAARQIARSDAETRAALEEAVQEATNPELFGMANPQTRQSRDWLLRAVIKRMGPIQRLDTRLFLLINGLPHSRLSNRAMVALSAVMNGGGGWVLFLLGAALLDRPRGRYALHSVVPPLWLATMAVELPIKNYFRRRRPFIDVVQAVTVGRKPMSYSFPSGHSAAAFAGAWLLRRHYPELTPLWYAIAALVGFSRIYLGAHYPGDVAVGALSGTLIAESARWSIEQGNTERR
jgi:undecaprenyl-diphosphatase